MSFFIAFVVPLVSQDDPLPDGSSLGSVTLRLGMSRDATLARLSESYQVNSSGLVMTKKGPPYDFLGSIGFDSQDQLDYISRDWGR